ncbi:WD40-repeat-containing domain protein [Lipomyces oligophaga]|uniref:WD40-repeat-containing domain protein n=1 Tax=Lipomyces oligophaga TaxID=45792 RepID=UPI0034CDC9B3
MAKHNTADTGKEISKKRKIKKEDDTTSLKKKSSIETRSETLTPILRVLTGSYEHQLLCLSLAASRSAFTHSSNIVSPSDKPTSPNVFTPIFHFAPHTASIRCIAHAKRYLVTGGNDEHIRLYDLQKRKEIGTLMHHEGSVTSLQFVKTASGNSGKWLVSGGEDGKILIWRTKDWEVLADMKGHKGGVNDIAIHPSGKIALSVGQDRTLRLWNLMTAKNASVLKLPGPPAIQVSWNSAGDRYAVGWQRRISIYDMNSKVLSTISLQSNLYKLDYGEIYEEEDISKDYLFYSDSNGKILCCDVAKATESEIPTLFELVAHTARVKDFAFCTRQISATISGRSEADLGRKTTFMSSVSSDGKIVIWNIQSREPIAVYETGERLNCCSLVPEEVERYDTMKRVRETEEVDESESEDLEDGDGHQ